MIELLTQEDDSLQLTVDGTVVGTYSRVDGSYAFTSSAPMTPRRMSVSSVILKYLQTAEPDVPLFLAKLNARSGA